VPRLLQSLVLLALAVRGASAGVPVPPRPDRYATDRAGVADAARLAALNEKLAQFERETSNQVLVYLDRRLPPNVSIEEFAVDAFKAWGVGQKGKDNGVVVFAFIDDRKFRIEVGYGLEGAVPDARARAIQEEHVLPRFKQGDFTGGLEAGAGELMKAARGEPYKGTGRTVAETPIPEGPMPLWLLLVPAGAGALGWRLGRPGADGEEHWARGAILGMIVAVVGLTLAGILAREPRALMLSFSLPLLAGSVAVPKVIGQGTYYTGRRRVGFGMIQGGVGLLFLAGGLLFMGGVWSGFGTLAVLSILVTVPLLLLGWVVKLEDPLRTFTIATGRLSFVIMLMAGLFFLLCLIARQGGILASGATTVAFVVLWIGAWILARLRGWRLLPKIEWSTSGGGGSSSWSSSRSRGSSWSSSSSSSSSSGSSGSSFSGGGGRSGGGGSSGSW